MTTPQRSYDEMIEAAARAWGAEASQSTEAWKFLDDGERASELFHARLALDAAGVPALVERAERAEQERGEALNKLKAIRDERAKGRWVPYED